MFWDLSSIILNFLCIHFCTYKFAAGCWILYTMYNKESAHRKRWAKEGRKERKLGNVCSYRDSNPEPLD